MRHNTGWALGRGDCKNLASERPALNKIQPKSTGANHHGKRAGVVQ
jgi:hypothetical protein